ncbi:MAG: hypothetical protein V4538_13810 [Bacteroidota bacterium]
MKKLILLILVLTSFSNSFSQTAVCTNFHRKYCDAQETGGDWRYNAQSRSALYAAGSTSKLRCVIYKGMDYRMSICTEPLLGNPTFKIYDSRTNELLFDSKNPATNVFEFQSTNTRQLVVELELPKTATAKPSDAGCVGFLILHKSTDRQGF